MKISDVILAEIDSNSTPLPFRERNDQLPPIGEAMYQYVVAGNGLFIRAEDSRMRALIQIVPAQCNGLADLIPFAELKVDRVPGVWLRSVLASARKRLPDEAMYEFIWDGTQHHAVTHTWRCVAPRQRATPTAVDVLDCNPDTVIDLHSHNSMAAFFSATDDADEQGLRFYAVIGHVDTDTPEIRVRVGVYGHFMEVTADTVFDDLGPFVDMTLTPDPSPLTGEGRACRVCGCTDEQGCADGCHWVEIDLCSNCVTSVYDFVRRLPE